MHLLLVVSTKFFNIIYAYILTLALRGTAPSDYPLVKQPRKILVQKPMPSTLNVRISHVVGKG